MDELGLRIHQWIYLHSGGWIGHRLIGVPSLILRTVGRRTGTPRANALVYARDGQDLVVTASNGGLDSSPGWYFNALASPNVVVQIGPRRMAAQARPVQKGDADYERLWALVNANNHHRYERYQTRTQRPIPMLALRPVPPVR